MAAWWARLPLFARRGAARSGLFSLGAAAGGAGAQAFAATWYDRDENSAGQPWYRYNQDGTAGEPLPGAPPDGSVYMASERGFAISMLDGHPYPPNIITAEGLADVRRDMQLREGDVVIATYPKCGTTWLQQIVLLLFADGDKSKVTDPMHQSPWIETWVSNAARKRKQPDTPIRIGWATTAAELSVWDPPPEWRAPGAPPRRVFKTHAPYGLHPWRPGAGGGMPQGSQVIVVSRGPRDQMISNYHHARNVPPHKWDGDLDYFARRIWGLGRTEGGDFWHWHAAWWNSPYGRNKELLWLRYEDLQEDLPGAVRQIASFLGMTKSDEVIDRVVEASTFQSMKQQFAEADEAKLKSGQPVKKDHMRQGKSGAWSKVLTQEQTEWIDALHARRMAAEGLTEAAIADC
eukprot:TRINITY_DN575_c2_g1_i1.p1 TRINITY_DN575_c2_g1~~TRINITY_DN575_c2_g1_i1.p1  ORF type:complete len:427 (+),score=110.94 TRINITY_DN575_c2_g1_i1:72-1283(+)